MRSGTSTGYLLNSTGSSVTSSRLSQFILWYTSIDKLMNNVGRFDVNLSLLVLPYSRILLVQGGFTAYFAVDGLLASYLLR